MTGSWTNALPLSVLVTLVVFALSRRHPARDAAVLWVSGFHLAFMLVIPHLPGPTPLHSGLWDGLFALGLAQAISPKTESVRSLIPIALVASLLHLLVSLSPPAPASELAQFYLRGVGLLGFIALALYLQPREALSTALALACGLLGWTGPDAALMMGLKLALVMSLLLMLHSDRAQQRVRFEKALVQTANQLELPFRLTAQALFHVPVPILLVESASRDVLYANGSARAALNGFDWSRRPLSTLFLELQPTGPQQEEGLILEPNGLIRRLVLHTLSAPGEAGPLEIVSLSSSPLPVEDLTRLLVDGRSEVHGTGRCLTDGRFSIAAASPGWQQHLGRLDRYFQSGSVWDKLRMVSHNPATLIQSELELERSQKTLIQIDTTLGSSLEIRALGFRDARASSWYLFEIQAKEAPPR